MKNSKGIAIPAGIKFLFNCFFIVCFTIPVTAQLHADFSVSSAQGCSPLTVQFRDLSTGNPTSWFWDFGNNTTSFLKNPTVVYSDSGRFTVTLIIRNGSDAAYEEKRSYITVFPKPVPLFTSDVNSGCAPLRVAFTNTTNVSNIQVQSWLWDFGDGTTAVSPNPTHIFQTRGTYPVSLTATTVQGCVDTFTSVILAGNKPKANFTVSLLDGCASELRYFTNNSSGDLSSYSWDFGDGGTSSEANPEYHYQDTGWFSVKLVVADNGCKDSIEKQQLVHVAGPIADIAKRINCEDRFTVRFGDLSIGEVTRKWFFGDGTTSVLHTDTHVYSSEGVYTVTLRVDNGKCSDTASDVINVSTKKPDIKLVPQKGFYCKGDSVGFVFTNYDTVFARSFAWDFGDDSIITGFSPRFDSTTHVYYNNGRYNVVGYLRDYAFCVDTVALDSAIIISGPTAAFSFSKPTCTGMPINFEDMSEPAKESTITQWVWNFDDGTVRNVQNPVYSYLFPLTYNVGLRVRDSDGCTDSINHEVTVSDMPIVQAGTDTLLCAGQSATLHASGAISYLWSNANGLSCTDCSDPVAKPRKTSTYYVTGSNAGGCSSVDSVLVIVQPKVDITASAGSSSICAGDSVQLQAGGADSYSWTPEASLNDSAIANPIAYPAATTTYIVTGTDSNACFSDTAMLNIVVNPKPIVNIADSIVKVLSGSLFQIRPTYSADVRSWQWLPVTGLSCANCPQPFATIKNNITYTVNGFTQWGCSATDGITIVALCTDKVLYMPNTFSPNRDGVNDYFFPRSNKDAFIKAFKVFNRWGQAVFEKMNFPANNYSYGWDGKFNHVDQKSDVYVYMMEVQCSDGNTVIKKGDVSLIR